MRQRFSFKYSFTLFVVVLVILFCTISGLAQTTAFTYQGKLTDSGNLANGNYDLQFALWNSLSGGVQVGSTQTLNVVAVSNGVFTVSLDFGANSFPGANRFLEISARPSSSGSFTLLTPRQPITSTPYAVRSLNASSADTVTVNGNPAFSVTGTGNFANSNTITGVGAGAANTPDSSGNGSQNSFYGNNAGASNMLGAANSFFGASAGSANTGDENSFFGQRAGFVNTTGSVNSFFGLGAGSRNTTGQSNTFIGEGTNIVGESTSPQKTTLVGANAAVQTGLIFNPINATAIGADALVTNSNSLVLGSINGVNGASANTNVGIGTTAPTARLHVVGTTGLIGDVGIGTTAPTAKLSVIATGDGARLLHLGTERAWVFRQAGTGAATALELTSDNANNPKDFVITGNNVGIGTTGPLDRLHVIGDIRVGVFGTNGCLKNNNGGTIVGTCSSDVRFKRDLVPFQSVLPKLTRLQPKYYFWRPGEFPEKNFGAAREAGLVAQEVEQVLPELVTEDEQGYKLVDYSKLPLMLLQAIKEQQILIEIQRRQIAGLKKLLCRSHAKVAVCK